MSSDWAPLQSLSSDDVLSFRFRIWGSSLSKPLSTTVLVKPLSLRHLGHFYCNPCTPIYHSLTHFWQPIRLLHSLHAIRGFLAGILLQIIHEKASSNSSKKETLNCVWTLDRGTFLSPSLLLGYLQITFPVASEFLCCLWGRLFAFFLLGVAWFQFLAPLPRPFSFVLGALQPIYLTLQTLFGIKCLRSTLWRSISKIKHKMKRTTMAQTIAR